MSTKTTNHKNCKIVVAGVGGQGAITIAQLVLGAAFKDNLYALQSEVHGMSQRGGAVNAHVMVSEKEVFSPVVMAGDGDLLISLEPLEALRYLPLLKPGAHVVVATEPVINMDHYPQQDELLAALRKVSGIKLIDVAQHAKELNAKKSGNIILLGAAARHMGISPASWRAALAERFAGKGEALIAKNHEAFDCGYQL